MMVAILGLASTTLVKGMRFDLKTGATKCITEDIKLNAMTIGKYSIVNPVEGFPLSEEDRVSVRVYHFFKYINSYFLVSLFWRIILWKLFKLAML